MRSNVPSEIESITQRICVLRVTVRGKNQEYCYDIDVETFIGELLSASHQLNCIGKSKANISSSIEKK